MKEKTQYARIFFMKGSLLYGIFIPRIYFNCITIAFSSNHLTNLVSTFSYYFLGYSSLLTLCWDWRSHAFKFCFITNVYPPIFQRGENLAYCKGFLKGKVILLKLYVDIRNNDVGQSHIWHMIIRFHKVL